VQQSSHIKTPLHAGPITKHLWPPLQHSGCQGPSCTGGSIFDFCMACWSVYRPKENLEVHRCSKLHTVQFPSAPAIFLITSAQPKIPRQFPRLPGTPLHRWQLFAIFAWPVGRSTSPYKITKLIGAAEFTHQNSPSRRPHYQAFVATPTAQWLPGTLLHRWQHFAIFGWPVG
jgi:hypothetical protein